MIYGIDIGGTKTLIARFGKNMTIEKEVAFATPKSYDDFINGLPKYASSILTGDTTKAVTCVGVPGLLDRKSGVVLSLGNLPWANQHIAHDIKNTLKLGSVVIENDAKLAGLAEVKSLTTTPKRALYLTISTGIGGALLIDGKLSKDMIDMELGKTPLMFEGRLQHWEEFASGRAFVGAYGTNGGETSNPKVWQSFVQERLGPGLVAACSFLQIDTVIFGGGLGHHSSQFASYIGPYLEERLHSIVKQPVQYRSAKYGRNAVIYGCYHYAKATF